MKKHRLLMTQPAVNDLQDIADYIADELREPIIAKKFYPYSYEYCCLCYENAVKRNGG